MPGRGRPILGVPTVAYPGRYAGMISADTSWSNGETANLAPARRSWLSWMRITVEVVSKFV